MSKFLFILASTATLAMTGPASAQIYPSLAPPAGIAVTPGFTPGYTWREQRANEDWRNNTWREQRDQEDWRNNNWRTQRTNEDWRQRDDFAKDRTPNNAIDRGYVECGVGSAGSSIPCRGYANETSKNDLRKNDLRKERTENDYTRERTRNNDVDKFVGECSVRLCR
jgi:hypothetical protein